MVVISGGNPVSTLGNVFVENSTVFYSGFNLKSLADNFANLCGDHHAVKSTCECASDIYNRPIFYACKLMALTTNLFFLVILIHLKSKNRIIKKRGNLKKIRKLFLHRCHNFVVTMFNLFCF